MSHTVRIAFFSSICLQVPIVIFQLSDLPELLVSVHFVCGYNEDLASYLLAIHLEICPKAPFYIDVELKEIVLWDEINIG